MGVLHLGPHAVPSFSNFFNQRITRSVLVQRNDHCPQDEWHKMAKISTLETLAMSLNISLPAELENRVRDHVASGMYGSASEVIREALRLFEAYQTIRSASFAALKADIAQGMADVQAGRVREMDITSSKTQGRALLQPENNGI
jgi:antitoxin ParD1/3/4